MKWKIFRLISCSLTVALALIYLVVTSPEPNEPTEAALKIHEKECARCHGKEGAGDGPTSRLLKVKPANWQDPERMARLSDEDLAKAIKGGGAALGGSKLMPAFESKLTDEQINELIVLVRSLVKKE